MVHLQFRTTSTQNQRTKSLSQLPISKNSSILQFVSRNHRFWFRMGTTLFTSYRFSCNFHQPKLPSHVLQVDAGKEKLSSAILNRRSVLLSGVSLVSSAALGLQKECLAAVKQGPLAGRIPGLSEPDEQGWRTYRRPDEKSGGHGVGWSPIIPYAFSVPQDWEEVPVSIADLGGTEIDLRFGSSKEGRLFVIVAPVRRFSDVIGDDATIEMVGPPEKVISAFGPEVIGENVEGKVIDMNVAEHSGRTYYQFELEPPHVLITATAAGNRLYLFNVTANGLQWKRHYRDLKRIADSFRVV